MAEDKFNVIIVGGGLAGCAAAYKLAGAGLEVLVVERGNFCGSKNMTGGRLYTYGLEKLIPDFTEKAPLERKIRKDRFTYVENGQVITEEMDSSQVEKTESDSYSVLRSELDRYMAETAEEAGAMFCCGIRVDDLLVRDGKVCGVIAGDEEMESDLVILADGVNSLMAQKIGLRKEPEADQVEVGAKEVITLDAGIIEERFGLAENEGMSWMFTGEAAYGGKGSGFLYTNRNSVSIGVLMKVKDIENTEDSVVNMLDTFKENPLVKPLLEGGKTVEYSAHLLPKSRIDGESGLYGDGVLVAGDAAGLVMNRGYVVRGMDLAVESGILAAEVAIGANEAEDFSGDYLKAYRDILRDVVLAEENQPEEVHTGKLQKVFD